MGLGFRMKIFERYLFREVSKAAVVALFAFMALFSFFEFVSELEWVGRDGYSAAEAVVVSVLRMPARAYETIPIAVLLGALYSLSLLAKNSELNVLRTAGVSSAALLRGLFAVGAVFAVITLLVGEYVAPASDAWAQQVRPKGTRSKVSLELRSGFWLKDGTTYLNIRSVQPNAKLVGLSLYEFGDDGRLKAISRADDAEYVPPSAWRMRFPVKTEYSLEMGSRVSTQAERLWHSDLNPDMLGVLNILPEVMGISTLMSYIKHLRANKQHTARYEAAFWKKVVYPLAAFVMVALALPFAFMQGRQASMGVRLFIGVMVGLGFYMLNGLSATFGLLNQWPPLLTSVAPVVLFIGLASMLLWVSGRR